MECTLEHVDANAIDVLLLLTLQDQVKHRQLVKWHSQEAQSLLNLQQVVSICYCHLPSVSSLSHTIKCLGFPLDAFLKYLHTPRALIKFCTSGLYPESMTLKGIELIGEDGGEYVPRILAGEGHCCHMAIMSPI